MRLRLFVVPVLAVCIFVLTVPVYSQVVPAYQENSLDLRVGAGGSSYDVDWGHGRMLGETIWADWYSRRMPRLFRGLGLELEARDISHDRHLPPQANIRQDTAVGGAIYAWRHFQFIHPYAKFLAGYGSYDFTSANPHDSHTDLWLMAPGVGFEVRVYRPIWVRADYEYQTWQPLLGNTPDPQGFTAGVAYSFAYPYPSRH